MTKQTNTNSVGGHNNRNPNIGRGEGRGRKGFDSHRGCAGCRYFGTNTSIAKSLFEGNLNDGSLHKLTITEGLHQATQLKKKCNALSILCVNMNFKYLNDVICNNQELVEVNHILPYPDSDLCPSQTYVKINTVNQNHLLEANVDRPVIKLLTMKTHIFNDNV